VCLCVCACVCVCVCVRVCVCVCVCVSSDRYLSYQQRVRCEPASFGSMMKICSPMIEGATYCLYELYVERNHG
jgi:hypothetical protein